MATINLASYFILHPKLLPKGNEPFEVTLDDIPGASIKHGPDCLLAMYGFKNAVEHIARQRDAAQKANKLLFTVRMDCEVNEWIPHIMQLSDLPSTECVDLGRLSSELYDLVEEVADRNRASLRMPLKSDKHAERLNGRMIIRDYPDIVPYLKKRKEFAHIKVFNIQVNRTVPVAVIFKGARISNIRPTNLENATILLPSYMTSRIKK